MNRATLTPAIVLILFFISEQAFSFSHRQTPFGKKVRWFGSRTEVILDPSLSLLGEPKKVVGAIKEAFAEWRQRTGLPIDFVFLEKKCAGYEKSNLDHTTNCIMASKTGEIKAQDQGAITHVSYEPISGQIMAADIVFNAVDWQWTTDNTVKGALDVSNIASHEIGHFLGLAHSDIANATMFAKTSEGETSKQTLATDDIEAIALLYKNSPQKWSKIDHFAPSPRGDQLPSWLKMVSLLGMGIERLYGIWNGFIVWQGLKPL